MDWGKHKFSGSPLWNPDSWLDSQLVESHVFGLYRPTRQNRLFWFAAAESWGSIPATACFFPALFVYSGQACNAIHFCCNWIDYEPKANNQNTVICNKTYRCGSRTRERQPIWPPEQWNSLAIAKADAMRPWLMRTTLPHASTLRPNVHGRSLTIWSNDEAGILVGSTMGNWRTTHFLSPFWQSFCVIFSLVFYVMKSTKFLVYGYWCFPCQWDFERFDHTPDEVFARTDSICGCLRKSLFLEPPLPQTNQPRKKMDTRSVSVWVWLLFGSIGC